MAHDIRATIKPFQLSGRFLDAEPYGNGHINDTYLVRLQEDEAIRTYIHQRINHDVFTNPLGVMENVQRITEHIRRKWLAADAADQTRRGLVLIPTHDNRFYHQDPQGNVWRTYHFIDQCQSYEVPESPAQAFEVGKAFGEFQQLLVDLPGERLIETIPDFHNSPKRFAALKTAIEADVANRAAAAQTEIEFALRHGDMVGVLIELQEQGLIPERVTHNDTKINNVLIDDDTGKALCVVDLDTVMPGLALYDFGDMVRTATCLAAEDEQDLSKIEMAMPLFEALTEGYLSTAGDFLTQTEKDYLAFSGKLITFEIGIRFLTDHLAGDTYFKIQREGHNLDRCRTQFKLVESIVAQEDAMNRFVERITL